MISVLEVITGLQVLEKMNVELKKEVDSPKSQLSTSINLVDENQAT